jgi:hypothetical protein
MDLGLAPLPLGVGAMSVWGARREGLAEPAEADLAQVARRSPQPGRRPSLAEFGSAWIGLGPCI